MKENSLKISDLARASGMNPGTVSAMISGNKTFSVHQLDRITETMGHPAGYYYERYFEESLNERTPNWRRIYPFLSNCAKLNKLACIQRVVDMLLDKVGYNEPLFEFAEELFHAGLKEAAGIIYEKLAVSMKKQHSERLAVCHYRLFMTRQGANREKSYEAAVQFEYFVDRLEESIQLEALKDLVNTYRSLRKWEKVDHFAKTLRNLAEAQMKLEGNQQNEKEEIQKQKSKSPPFAYWAFSHLLQAEVCYIRKDYEQALEHNYAYSDLSWVKETDESTLSWKSKYKAWAEANIYVNKLMSGQASVLPEYVAYFSSKNEEILTALDNIIEAANQYNIDVDDLLKQFQPEILSLLKEQKGGGVYNQQFIRERFTHFTKELAVYHLRKESFPAGFKFLFSCLEKSTAINNKSYIIKCTKLFESYRKHATSEMKAAYRTLINEVEEDED
ncbi:DNA-binding protein (plasmid) [Paenibacillus peoriae]|nr:DNA-binding protein [Paenibacillus peoriae]